MRKKRPVSIFNISFLDIMTSLIFVAIILLFSVSTLFSNFPYTEKYKAEIDSLKTRITRLKNVEDSLSIEIEKSPKNSNDIQESIKTLPRKVGLSQEALTAIKRDELNIDESQQLTELPSKITQLNLEITKLKDQVGVLRSQFVKRRYEWIKEMMNTNLKKPSQIKQIPIFYKVDSNGIIDFETNKRINLDALVKKHLPIKKESYPLFIIEKSGFRFWMSTTQTVENLAVKNDLLIGYEPYSKDHDVIYENFFIKKP